MQSSPSHTAADGIEQIRAQYEPAEMYTGSGNFLIESLPTHEGEKEVKAFIRLYTVTPPVKKDAPLPQRIKQLIDLTDGRFVLLQDVMPLELLKLTDYLLHSAYTTQAELCRKETLAYIEKVKGEGREPDYFLLDRLNTGCKSYEAIFANLIGMHGTGKTLVLEHVLALYPRIIVHDSIPGIEPFKQLLWLKISLPEDGSHTGMLRNLLQEIYNLTGDSRAEQLLRLKRPDAFSMEYVAQQLLSCYHVGLIAVDAIHHIVRPRSFKANAFYTLLQLSRHCQTAVLMCGLPLIDKFACSEFYIARRFSNHGRITCTNLKSGSDAWRTLKSSIFDYRIIKLPEDEEQLKQLDESFYYQTQGIPELMVRLFAAASLKGLLEERGELNAALLEESAAEFFADLKPLLKSLRSGKLTSTGREAALPINSALCQERMRLLLQKLRQTGLKF